MHAKALEIAWHEGTPVWSVDVSCTNRVVTAGGDKVARVWRLHPQAATLPSVARPSHVTKEVAVPRAASPAGVDWLCDLRAHLTTVNVARFNRCGDAIASGADQGEIILWQLTGSGSPELTPLEMKEAAAAAAAAAEPENVPRERWNRQATLRGHVQDVLDLAWSADGLTLVSASVDNSVMIWDVRDPTRPPVTLRAHSNFVQGVAIDPIGKIIASLGNDRTFRVYSRVSQRQWAQVASLTSITSDARLFIDDAKLKTFFRRLAWSPDGSVIACPSGLQYPQTKRTFAVHLFSRFQWAQPAVQCGGLPSPACAVRFSPVLYALRREPSPDVPLATPEAHSSTASQSSNKTGESVGEVVPSSRRNVGPFEGFLYRMILAVACVDCVLFYDTESFSRPFARVEGLHCAEHTDIAWSADGLQAVVGSVDGYAGVVSFEQNELGTPLREDQLPRWLRELSLSARQLPNQGAKVDLRSLQSATRVDVPLPEKQALVPEREKPPLASVPEKQPVVPRPQHPLSHRFGSTGRKTGSVENEQAPAPGDSFIAAPKRDVIPPIPEVPSEVHFKAALEQAFADVRADEADDVTFKKTSGQGYRISTAQPGLQSAEPEAVSTPKVPAEPGSCLSVSNAPGPEKPIPVSRASPVRSEGRKNELGSPAVTVVFPRRRPNTSAKTESSTPDTQVALASPVANADVASTPVSASRGSVGSAGKRQTAAQPGHVASPERAAASSQMGSSKAEPVVKAVTPKRRMKPTMVTTFFKRLQNEKQDAGSLKRKSIESTGSAQSEELKRRKADPEPLVDLT